MYRLVPWRMTGNVVSALIKKTIWLMTQLNMLQTFLSGSHRCDEVSQGWNSGIRRTDGEWNASLDGHPRTAIKSSLQIQFHPPGRHRRDAFVLTPCFSTTSGSWLCSHARREFKRFGCPRLTVPFRPGVQSLVTIDFELNTIYVLSRVTRPIEQCIKEIAKIYQKKYITIVLA